jgi:hypothetical protein
MSKERPEFKTMRVNESFPTRYDASYLVRHANKRHAPKKWVCRKGPLINWVVVRVK